MKRNEEAVAAIKFKFASLAPLLDERARRVWAATESRSMGYGGDAAVSAATGLSRAVIRAGRGELDQGIEAGQRIRRPGGGRPSKTVAMPGVIDALEKLIDPVTRGDPESPLRWTTKSCEKLAHALTAQGFPTSSSTVWRLLRELGAGGNTLLRKWSDLSAACSWQFPHRPRPNGHGAAKAAWAGVS